IDALITAPPFTRAIWGIDIENDDGTVVYEHNAGTLMIPASNRKLFAMATASDCLGFDARFTTELWLDGDDLVIGGDGDPSLGSWRHESQGFAPFLEALRARGIRNVRDVVADVSRFDRVTLPGSWKVGNLIYDYSAPVDAIAFEENAIGDYSVPDAGLFAARRFREELQFAGIEVTGDIRTVIEPRTLDQRIAIIESPFLAQLLTTAMKNSHNLYAEMLFKRTSADGTYDEAEALEASFLTNEVGIAPGEFRFVDGSGLAPDDLVTPFAIIRVLRWINAPERRGMWWPILAVPGELGTLHYRLTEFADRLRGKTGTVNGVNSISGIIAGRNGGYRYFAIVLNHHLAGSSEATRVLDSVVRAIADF
ncbi:MAG: D-alanyl-D-alanine carboxypeptidase/D-alanyl-D-alanine-endopeptidase, partial [Thermoanaerobaculia bacterium]